MILALDEAWGFTSLTSIWVILCCWSEDPSLSRKFPDQSTDHTHKLSHHFNIRPTSEPIIPWLPSVVNPPSSSTVYLVWWDLKCGPWTHSINITRKWEKNSNSQNLHPKSNKSDVLELGTATCDLISKWCGCMFAFEKHWPSLYIGGSSLFPFLYFGPTTLNQWFHLKSTLESLQEP